MTRPIIATPSHRSLLLRALAAESKAEFIKSLRMPIYSVSAIGFPLMFYLIFSTVFGQETAGNVSMAAYMLATMGTIGVMSTAMFGFGVSVAAERDRGWLRLKRASAMPPAAYLVSKLVTALIFSALVVLILFLAGALVNGVRMPLASWLKLMAFLVPGALPFCALGLWIGMAFSANAAPLVVNLIYLPSAFASGQWMPLEILPGWLQSVAVYLPPYHLGQLALSAIGADRGGSPWLHAGVLLLATLVFTTLALLAQRRGSELR